MAHFESAQNSFKEIFSEQRSRLFFDLLRWSLEVDPSGRSPRLAKWLSFTGNTDESIALRHFRGLNPHDLSIVQRAISQGQIESKLWFCSALSDVMPPGQYNICLIGSWIGVLGRLMSWRNSRLIRRLVLIDQDPTAVEISKRLMKDLIWDGRVEVFCADANNFDFSRDYHIIVNLACEHLVSDKWFQNIPEGRIVALQSTNDRSEPDHVACVSSLAELRQRLPVEMNMYSGVRGMPKGARYMVIGKK